MVACEIQSPKKEKFVNIIMRCLLDELIKKLPLFIPVVPEVCIINAISFTVSTFTGLEIGTE